MPTTDQTAFALIDVNRPRSWKSGTTTLTPTAGLLDQCIVEMTKVCKGILDESSGTTNHANRLTFAQSLLFVKGPRLAGMMVLASVVQNTTVQGSATDANVRTVIDALLPGMIPT